MSKYYVVYDGRYIYDEDAAQVVKAMGEFETDEDATNEYLEYYAHGDTCLVVYDLNNKELTNARVIYCDK